jgi:hypothetical protein
MLILMADSADSYKKIQTHLGNPGYIGAGAGKTGGGEFGNTGEGTKP